jgi:signal transduction histidine kinase
VTTQSPTYRLLAGLALTLAAVGVYSAYTVRQLNTLERLQAETIDRNRTDTLLLLRIQNGLNSLALTMRDMLDTEEPYPLTAWQPQFKRIRSDLENALAREEKFTVIDRTPGQRQYLSTSFRQFWDSLDRLFELAAQGDEEEVRHQIRMSLQARHAALSTAVSRQLIENNQSEEAAARRAEELYSGVERNVYFFLVAMVVFIVLSSLYIARSNRRLFDHVANLSQLRSELAQQLISMQESTFRSISRELHDEFGQILTAVGVMMKREDRHAGDLTEVRLMVQGALDKVRDLSRALHPVVLDELGLESALDVYLPSFQKQTGIRVVYTKRGDVYDLDRETAIHLYRVVQEGLNNVARHSGSRHADVRLTFLPELVRLEVEDDGIGFGREAGRGLGLISMRERAELLKAKLEFLQGDNGGALVRITVPLGVRELRGVRAKEESHAR